MGMTLARRWWILAVRGAAAIIFGILTFVAPRSSLYVLVILFGIYALVDGAFDLGMAARGSTGGRRWGSLVFEGVASMVAGFLALAWPGISALVLLLIVAVWAVVTGVSALMAAIRLRQHVEHEWMLGVSGLLSIGFGVLLFLFPGPGAIAVVLWIGAYAIVLGGLLMALAFRLRAWGRAPERRLPTDGGGLQVPA
jgi:uncharacterized membrane protein HdeD (DUF308 family)